MAAARREYKIISADSHTVEPPDLWEKWLDKKYLDTAPKLVDDGTGGHAWLYMGATTPEPLGLVTCVGTHPEQLKWTGARYGETIHPSCHDGAERLKIMDEDGVDAEMLYPPQRAMLTFMKNKDTDAHLAGIQAYNRWLKDGFCAPDPERLIGIFQMPNVGIETAVSELKRAKKEGFRGVAISAWPSGGDNLRPEDDPFWETAADLDLPVSIHLLLAAQQTKTRRVEVGGGGDRRDRVLAHHAADHRADLPGRVRPLPEAAHGGGRDRRRLDPALPRDDRRPLLAEPHLGRHQAQEGAERLLPRPLARDVHRRPQRRLGAPPGRRRQHVVVDRLPAPRQRLAVLAHASSTRCSPTLPEEERRKIVCDNAARFWGLSAERWGS